MSGTLALDLGQEEMREFDVALGALEGIAAQLEATQRLREIFVRESREMVRMVLGFPEQLRRRWQQCCRAGWAGRAEEVHALRGPLLERFNLGLKLIQQTTRIAEAASALAGAELTGAQLEELGRKYPPPPAWYEQEGKPF
jgi:hypothetical protein